MIAGETEYIIGRYNKDSDYDNLFGIGKKLSEAEKKAKKVKRQEFWGKFGSRWEKEGGLSGIGQSIGNISQAFGRKGGSGQPSNFQFGIGEDSLSDEQRKGFPKEILIGGIVVLAAFGLWGYSSYKKNQMLQMASTK